MSEAFLTIRQAADTYARSEITIRRFVRGVASRKDHPNRVFVRPTPAEVKKLKKRRTPFAYTVSKELLGKIYGAQKRAAERGSSTANVALEETLSLFRQQLSVKDEQIRALTTALDSLSQRQRETNILMKGLQERLLLPAEAASKKRRWWLF